MDLNAGVCLYIACMLIAVHYYNVMHIAGVQAWGACIPCSLDPYDHIDKLGRSKSVVLYSNFQLINLVTSLFVSTSDVFLTMLTTGYGS